MKRFALGIALTFASSPTVVAQEVASELYGEFRYSYNHADTGDSTHWAGANNASRLGLRAQVAGNALTVFADLQASLNVEAEKGGGASPSATISPASVERSGRRPLVATPPPTRSRACSSTRSTIRPP